MDKTSKGKCPGHSMRNLACVLFAVAGCRAAWAQAANGMDADELWSRAEAAWKIGAAYAPTGMVVVSTELDGKGKATKTEELEYRISYEGGTARPELVRAVENGKDVTEKRRAADAKSKDAAREDDGRMFEDTVPFSGLARPKLERGDATPRDGGLRAAYRIKDRESGYAGFANFGAGGDAESLDYRSDPLPDMVTRMEGRIGFERLADGALVVSSCAMEGEAVILFVKKGFRMTMRFTGYRRVK